MTDAEIIQDQSTDDVKIFRSRLDGISYVFPNGKTVMFKDRKYETSDAREINHLQDEISKNHPSFYSGDPETVVALSGVVLQGVVNEDGDDVIVEDETEDPSRIHDDASTGIKSISIVSEEDTKQSNS